MTGAIAFLLLAIGVWAFSRRATRRRAVDAGMLADRVAVLERELVDLKLVVEELDVAPGRRPQREPDSPPAAAEPPPAPAEPPPVPAAPTWERPVLQPRVAATPRTRRPRLKLSLDDLMSAKALAFAGGVVTLLGIVFFFVLAVNRGWIGPGVRIACGGVASSLVFSAGFVVRRRYGMTYSALAAVGVGIAGGYATLLASVELYDMVSKPAALGIAAAIAAIGVATSISWSSEIVAAFGLIGAMLVPATLVFQGGLQEIGTAFVAVVFAGSTVVAVHRRWWYLLRLAAVISVAQALAQVGAAEHPHASIVVLAAVFWVLYTAAGLAYQLRLGSRLGSSPAVFILGGVVFAGVSAALLYGRANGGVDQGLALLGVASVYLLLAAVLYRRSRELATLVWAVGLTAAALGVADALSGPSVTYAWAAEAAVLAWLSTRVRESRFQLASLAYLVLACVHALAVEARPDHLFALTRHPATGAPALLAIAAAASIFARFARPIEGEDRAAGVLALLEPALDRLRRSHAVVDSVLVGGATLLVVYAGSLGLIELLEDVWPGGSAQASFEWGHVAVSSTWSLLGVAVVLLAVRVRSELAARLGFGWLAVTAAKVTYFDAVTLTHTRLGISLVVVGGAALTAGLAFQLPVRDRLRAECSAAIPISLGLVVAGSLLLARGEVLGVDASGIALLAVGVAYAVLGALVFPRVGQRDLSTLLWALGLAVTVGGEWILLDRVWLVLVLTATTVGLGLLGMRVGEERLHVASLLHLALAAGYTLVVETPPLHLVQAREHPGAGLWSLALVIGATVVLAWAVGPRERERVAGAWTAATLAVYGGSLAILDVTQRISSGDLHTSFQRGHTVVSAFWGLLGLALLYVGLKGRRRLLRAGGFALFAVSLGKIFLYDLPNLSSVQRALSFLAVGAVLLVGGFFYQRLSVQNDRRAV